VFLRDRCKGVVLRRSAGQSWYAGMVVEVHIPNLAGKRVRPAVGRLRPGSPISVGYELMSNVYGTPEQIADAR